MQSVIDYGHNGSYRKLMDEFVQKDDSPGRRLHEASFLARHKALTGNAGGFFKNDWTLNSEQNVRDTVEK